MTRKSTKATTEPTSSGAPTPPSPRAVLARRSEHAPLIQLPFDALLMAPWLTRDWQEREIDTEIQKAAAGQQDPIIVRLVPPPAGEEARYEVIAGSRWLAAWETINNKGVAGASGERTAVGSPPTLIARLVEASDLEARVLAWMELLNVRGGSYWERARLLREVWRRYQLENDDALQSAFAVWLDREAANVSRALSVASALEEADFRSAGVIGSGDVMDWSAVRAMSEAQLLDAVRAKTRVALDVTPSARRVEPQIVARERVGALSAAVHNARQRELDKAGEEFAEKQIDGSWMPKRPKVPIVQMHPDEAWTLFCGLLGPVLAAAARSLPDGEYVLAGIGKSLGCALILPDGVEALSARQFDELMVGLSSFRKDEVWRREED
ncbi:MAG: hypothetical protein V4550_11660 [Gemmatimonadota bacterium]